MSVGNRFAQHRCTQYGTKLTFVIRSGDEINAESMNSQFLEVIHVLRDTVGRLSVYDRLAVFMSDEKSFAFWVFHFQSPVPTYF